MAKRMTDSGVTVKVETIQNAMHNEHYLSTQFWGFSTMTPSGRFSIAQNFETVKNNENELLSEWKVT